MSFYKYITFGILICLVAVFTYMCSHKDSALPDELGGIKAIPQKGTKIVESKSIFTPVKNEFGYAFKTYKNPRAKMELNLPSEWNVNWVTDRQIDLTTPENDKDFPDTSVFIRYDFGDNNIKTAREMIDAFKNELYKSTYRVGGNNFRILDYLQPDIKTDTRYTNGHDNLVASAITKDITIRNSEVSYDECTKIDYYVNWEGTPCVLSVIVPNEKADKMLSALKLIVSNIKYCEQEITETGKTAAINNEFKVQLTLPHQFKPEVIEDDYAIYRANRSEQTAFSGMDLLMMNYSGTDRLSVTEETIKNKYGLEWFRALAIDPQYFLPVFYCEEVDAKKIGGEMASVFEVEYAIMASDKEYDNYYILGETWKMKVYVLYGTKKTEVIALNYQDSQENLVRQIESLFVK